MRVVSTFRRAASRSSLRICWASRSTISDENRLVTFSGRHDIMLESNLPLNTGKKLRLILCWHMHQPDYREYLRGEYVLPWTYLHAMKDYTDMAFHLEQHPQAKAVVNFVPILIEQLHDYDRQFKSGEIRDELLRMLSYEHLDGLKDEARQHILDSCF